MKNAPFQTPESRLSSGESETDSMKRKASQKPKSRLSAGAKPSNPDIPDDGHKWLNLGSAPGLGAVWGVGSNLGGNVVRLICPKQIAYMPRKDALTLAAWIIHLSKPENGEFERILELVKSGTV